MPHYLREHIRIPNSLSPGWITGIDESYSFPFPADFRR